MPTVLTKEYLAGLAAEAAKQAAVPGAAAFDVLRWDMDTLKAGIAIQDRAGRLTSQQVQNLVARMEQLEQQAKAFQQRLDAQQAEHAQETRAALNEMRVAQREINRQAVRNREMMERVLARFAAEERKRGQ